MTGSLFVPLKRQPFEAFAAGTKRWEIRRFEGQWAKAKTGMGARLRLGYSGQGEIRRVVGRVITASSASHLMAALPNWQDALPWASDQAHAIQLVERLLLGDIKYCMAHLVAIEMLALGDADHG